MKPGVRKFISTSCILLVGLIFVSLLIGALLPVGSPDDLTIRRMVIGILVFLLTIALAMLLILSGKNRKLAEAAHAKEIEEIERSADRSVLRCKNLLECASDAIFLINAESGQLIEMNGKGSELFGYSREEMGKLQGKDLVPVRDLSLYGELVRRLARRGFADEVCINFKRKDGSRFLGEVSARVIDSGEGKLTQAIVRDITLKKQAELDIRRRNRKLAILNSMLARVNQSIHLHEVLDMTLQETMELFGAGGGTIHLRDERGLIPVAQKNLPARFLSAMCGDGAEMGHSCRMAVNRQCNILMQGPGPGDGCGMAEAARENGWLSIAGIPLFAGKRLVGVMHIFSAIEREFVPDDINFFTTMGNQLGIGIEHAKLFEELNRKSDELLRSHRLLEKNSLQLKISQHRLEKNLALVEQANMELERLDMMKNQFIGMVSHEFRTPLTSILSGTEFLLANYAVSANEDLHDILEMIYNSGKRLNEIFSNLMKVVKLESNAATIAMTTLMLGDVLDHAQSQLEPVMNERRQRICREGLEDIPFINGNREYLVEIFMQLLENAVKFTPDGGEIRIRARIAERSALSDKKGLLCRFNQRFYEQMGCKFFVEVEVRDSGIGIDPDEQLNIFDKFYEIGDLRHHSTGRHKFLGKGTGLGLAIVKGMVEAHGGMIWVESPGADRGEISGSAFFLLLPLEEDARQAAFPFMQAEAASIPDDGGINPEKQR
ncbi:MAG TPA: ATP-binding protein [Geobacteraceae bacterium]|nr:ATP-binding protein [Geobacteraceae bacterium]